MGKALVPTLFITVMIIMGKVSSEKLVWSDEFDSLDEEKWKHLVTAWDGGNQEFQYYRNSRNNSYVKDGVLYLKPTYTADEKGEDFLKTGTLSYPDCNMDPCSSTGGGDIVKPIQSARISSNYAFKYGRVEIKAKLPRGDWIWPAIWMLPSEWVYGNWPRSGEIDIMESKGNAGFGTEHAYSTLHWGVDYNHNNYWRTHWEKSVEGTGHDLADDFHLYGLKWTENYLKFTFDGEEIGTQNAPENGFWYFAEFQNNPGGENIWKNGSWLAPFDQEFQFILNVAVGGNFFGSDTSNLPWKWDGHAMRDFWEARSEWQSTWNGEDAALKIDYVRVYQ